MIILNHNYFAVDVSPMGAGKTHVTSKIIQELKPKHFMVICPKTVASNWTNVIKLYGLPQTILNKKLAVTTYQTLIGRGEGVNSMGILNRRLVQQPGHTDDRGKYVEGKKEVVYEVTTLFRKMVKDGFFIVFDESHKTKNSHTSTYGAVKAICSYVAAHEKKGNGNSKIVFITGTIFDKEEQISPFLRMVNIIQSKNLSTNILGNFKISGLGYQQLLDYCGVIKNSPLAEGLDVDGIIDNIHALHPPINTINVKIAAVNIYLRILQPIFVSKMPGPENIVFDARNGYFSLSVKKFELLTRTISQFASALRFDKRNDEIRITDAFKVITKYMAIIEYIKLEIFIRLAVKFLEENPHNKVVLMLNYIESISCCVKFLEKYKPMVVYGEIAVDVRTKVISKFNEPNSDRRLLIGNTTVMSLGIDLHSKDPNYFRYGLISPSYKITDTVQAVFRFYREGMRSDPYVRIVYAKDPSGQNLEKRILEAYAKKSKVIEKTSGNDRRSLPGNYPTDLEEDVIVDHKLFKYKSRKMEYIIDGDQDSADALGKPDKINGFNNIDNDESEEEEIIYEEEEKDIFEPDERNPEYRIFAEHFEGLELILRFAIYSENPQPINSTVSKKRLKSLTKNFDKEELFTKFLRFYEPTATLEDVTYKKDKYKTWKKAFSKVYKKHTNLEAGELWWDE